MRYYFVLFASFCFILNSVYSSEENKQKAQEHFDRAGEALIEAIGHSIGTGITIECPPLALFEGYQAVEAWKEAAHEYNEGCRIRDREEGE